ncbi:hypothetical protein LuPra_06228 [Luteitalea pratensis]|uniref:Uncharacterized protein n=1 Tax=Luteitalea pratensis TaxID=1855912 RepID=A0A143PYQ4_LUTPR|nr:hypothetical protein [Luteitalea pratensis]AMY12944.1 hypothetical protein LuPra_06228 [Luteitalea pratensis]
MHTVLFYVQHDNEVPILVPVEVVSREPDRLGHLRLVEPLKLKDAVVETVPLTRCYEYDPYLAHAVQAYAAQVTTLVRVSQSVIEGLAIPVTAPKGTYMQPDARVH